ncbi:MAG: hypothetical protein A2Z20_06710 [Bdellovibrionales bacterium RBG_16_40_8]|nr:MAG: hypothetical protein A2Z20_06710 [Bdellovibrionales bacterium RBG_16_40_8]
MSLKESINNLKFDARMVDINLRNQTLSKDDLKKYLDKLPDLKLACLVVEIENSDNEDMNGSSF